MHVPKPPLVELDLCFLDTETTGPVFGYHEIIDLAAVRTSPDGSEVREVWESRLRPRHPERITDFARQHNRFDEAVWDRAPLPSRELWTSFATFALDAVPVCHNPAFDRAFVQLAASAHDVADVGLDYHWIGTESLAWVPYRRGELDGVKLDILLEALDLDPEPMPHTAILGAQSCRLVYLELVGRLRLNPRP
jgi:DNA polymerase III epsilon subunit-like protein